MNLLPKVSLKDIPLSAKNYPLSQEKSGHLTLFHRTVFTNNIIYADLVYNLPNMSEADLSDLRLLTVVLTQMGCASRTYQENLEYIQGNTGGIGAGVSLNLQAANHLHLSPTFHLKGRRSTRKRPNCSP